MNFTWPELLDKFNSWMDEAKNAYENCYKKCPEFFSSGEILPHAFNLSTVSTDNRPSSRVVLMKDINLEGLSFYTNYDSLKGLDLIENTQSSAVFFWPTHSRQIRIRGNANRVTRQESENYWGTRHKISQISGSVSPQGKEIKSYQWIEEASEKFKIENPGPISCPKNWGGYRVSVLEIEFWQGHFHRLHNRELYSRPSIASLFRKSILAP